MLIALGSALFTLMSLELVEPGGWGDPSRVAAQIVSGIGFLGAGAILRTGASVHGLTTAATIWMNAAIGMAAGAGRYQLATAATITTLLVLTALVPVEKYFDARVRGARDPEDREITDLKA
jgi:putative Mg2+ transporter-C (MgtC) family protein